MGGYYVLFFIHVASRKVHVAGLTPYPNEQWMTQIARNVTMADIGFLSPHRYLIHDRDGKFCPSFVETIEAVGAKTVKLPPRSPNLNRVQIFSGAHRSERKMDAGDELRKCGCVGVLTRGR